MQAREKAREDAIKHAKIMAEIEAENKRVRDAKAEQWRGEKANLEGKIAIFKAEASPRLPTSSLAPSSQRSVTICFELMCGTLCGARCRRTH